MNILNSHKLLIRIWCSIMIGGGDYFAIFVQINEFYILTGVLLHFYVRIQKKNIWVNVWSRLTPPTMGSNILRFWCFWLQGRHHSMDLTRGRYRSSIINILWYCTAFSYVMPKYIKFAKKIKSFGWKWTHPTGQIRNVTICLFSALLSPLRDKQLQPTKYCYLLWWLLW